MITSLKDIEEIVNKIDSNLHVVNRIYIKGKYFFLIRLNYQGINFYSVGKILYKNKILFSSFKLSQNILFNKLLTYKETDSIFLRFFYFNKPFSKNINFSYISHLCNKIGLTNIRENNFLIYDFVLKELNNKGFICSYINLEDFHIYRINNGIDKYYYLYYHNVRKTFYVSVDEKGFKFDYHINSKPFLINIGNMDDFNFSAVIFLSYFVLDL